MKANISGLPPGPKASPVPGRRMGRLQAGRGRAVERETFSIFVTQIFSARFFFHLSSTIIKKSLKRYRPSMSVHGKQGKKVRCPEWSCAVKRNEEMKKKTFFSSSFFSFVSFSCAHDDGQIMSSVVCCPSPFCVSYHKAAWAWRRLLNRLDDKIKFLQFFCVTSSEKSAQYFNVQLFYDYRHYLLFNHFKLLLRLSKSGR